jgi:hypothetical protein
MIAMEPAGYRTSPVIYESKRTAAHMLSTLNASDAQQQSECEALRQVNICGHYGEESFGR